MKDRILKLLEENIDEYLYNLCIGKDFLNIKTWKAQTKRLINLIILALRSFFITKGI